MALDTDALIRAIPFPSPDQATEEGLLAYGGDLGPERLLAAYAQGVFPWYNEDPILWFSPDPRMVLPLEELHVSRSLNKTLRRKTYELRLDSAFADVIDACARVERPGQDGTWITDDMRRAYTRLHELGYAHSCETWCRGKLVGGIYGVALGAAFFGESMFAERSDASKVALVTLVRQLRAWDFDFMDCQVHTEHTARLGAREWPRDVYLAALDRALGRPTRRGRWDFDATCT